MEVEFVSITVWRWSQIECDVPIESYTFGVDAVSIGTRFHWFLKKTVMFELHGARVQIVRFLQRKLEDGSCRRIAMDRTLSRKLSKSIGSTASATST